MTEVIENNSRIKFSDFIVDRNVMVSMRDGVTLATDIYRPVVNGEPVATPLPVIMERTPYNKQGVSRAENSLKHPHPVTRDDIAAFFARQGYAVAMQDCRGRFRSEGVFVKYIHETEDGYDTLCWLVNQPWCDGRVGTMGFSYGAHTQTALACLNPPGLACVFIDSGGFSNAYHSGIRQGGAFELKQATWAYRHALLSPKTQADPERHSALLAEDISHWFHNMPWHTGHSPLKAAPEYEAYLFKQWRHDLFDDSWKVPGLYAEGFYDQFPDVPTAIVGSWYDPYVLTCLTNYQELSRRHKSPVHLLMGPWTHGDRSTSFAGEVDFGPQSVLDGNIAKDYLNLRLAWFDQCLKGAPSIKPAFEAPVTYFTMGGGDGRKNSGKRLQHGGKWQQSANWPPLQIQYQRYYFRSNGTLSTTSESKPDFFFEYAYDPKNPVPTIGGTVTSGEPIMVGGAFDQRENPAIFGTPKPYRCRQLAKRDDVLVFQTPPLEQDVEITGPIAVELWVSSDCPDTDFTAKLIDCYPPNEDYPDGFAMNITDGIFRMRYREGWEREVLMEPGKIYPITIEPFATSNIFKKGHRIRVDISSSNFPHFDVNPNSGESPGSAKHFHVANNRLYLDSQHLSSIILPIKDIG